MDFLIFINLFQVVSTSCRGVRGARTLVANRRVLFARRNPVLRAPATVTVQVLASDSETLSPYGERFRLNNLSPQEGCRKRKKRKGRGHAAGQVSNIFCITMLDIWGEREVDHLGKKIILLSSP